MQRLVLLAAAAAFSFSGAIAFAQSAAKTATKTPSAPRTTASIACSKQADAQGLHGTERRAFRSKCKREFKGFGYQPMPKSGRPAPKG